jgi:HTH-type transcriptional regulator/antitoxin HipB
MGYNSIVAAQGGMMEYLINTPAQLSVALKSRRKTRGLTQQQVAGSIGLLPKTISAFENGPDKSTLESLFKLLAALDLELIIRPKDELTSDDNRGEW